MSKIISYTKKNGQTVEVVCYGIKGTVLYGLIALSIRFRIYRLIGIRNYEMWEELR